jgi:hypothetical protein
MNRKLIVCASLLLAVGCEHSAKENQSTAEQAQREADQNAARIEQQAAEKRAQAQREADEKAAKATAEARKDIAEGQTKANEDIREANQDIIKARADFHVRTQKSVNDLDHKIDSMKTDAQKAPPKAQADFVSAMRDVDTKRAALDTDLRSMDSQPIGQFDSVKAKVNKEIDDLKKSIDVAHEKL